MKLQIVEAIPFQTFKEKIEIVKKYENKGHIEVLDGLIYIERCNYGRDNECYL